MVKYLAKKKKHHFPDVGTYTAWGINGWRDDGRGRIVMADRLNVFRSKGDAECFADLCT